MPTANRPARLAALARTYAQLGALTEYQWSSGASRLQGPRLALCRAAAGAKSEIARQRCAARAFVRALVGRHDLALADLDAASRLAEETKDATPAPSWLPVIDAYLKSDRKRLATSDGPHARLAALLDMMLVEYPHRTRVMVRAAHDLAARDADCMLAYDAICQNGQLGELHVATVAGPEVFTKIFPEKLEVAGFAARDGQRAVGPGPRRAGLGRRPSPVRDVPATTRASRRGAFWRIWPARPASCRPSAGWTSWRTCGTCRRSTPSKSSGRSSRGTASTLCLAIHCPPSPGGRPGADRDGRVASTWPRWSRPSDRLIDALRDQALPPGTTPGVRR